MKHGECIKKFPIGLQLDLFTGTLTWAGHNIDNLLDAKSYICCAASENGQHPVETGASGAGATSERGHVILIGTKQHSISLHFSRVNLRSCYR